MLLRVCLFFDLGTQKVWPCKKAWDFNLNTHQAEAALVGADQALQRCACKIVQRWHQQVCGSTAAEGDASNVYMAPMLLP